MITVVQSLSHIQLFATPWIVAHKPSLSQALSPEVCPNLRPLNQWCYLTILYSVSPFSFYPQSFSALGFFPVSQIFTSSDQSIGASASVFTMNSQGRFPLGLMVWSPAVQGILKSLLLHYDSKASLRFLYGPTLRPVHDYWKSHSFDYMDLCRQSTKFLLLNMLRSKHFFFFKFHGCSHCPQWFWSPRK